MPFYFDNDNKKTIPGNDNSLIFTVSISNQSQFLYYGEKKADYIILYHIVFSYSLDIYRIYYILSKIKILCTKLLPVKFSEKSDVINIIKNIEIS